MHSPKKYPVPLIPDAPREIVDAPEHLSVLHNPRGGFYLRVALLALADVVALHAALLIGVLMRIRLEQEANLFDYYLKLYLSEVVAFTLLALLVNTALRLYTSLWRYAGATEVVKIFLAAFLTVGARGLYDFLWTQNRLPLASYAVGMILYILGLSAIRLGYRLARRIRIKLHEVAPHSHLGPRTLIVGAGEAGSILLHAMAESPSKRGHIVALIDDDPRKFHLRLHGVRVEGGRDRIPEVVERLRIDRILVSLPSASHADMKEIVQLCLSTGKEVLKVIPEDLLSVQSVHGDFSLQTSLRVAAIQPEDLLGRDPVEIPSTAVESYLRDRTVLITGGAGSIGSELARQVAQFAPRHLIVFDYNENDSHALSQDLARRFPALEFTVVIGSVRDEAKLSSTFARYHPDVVFHAAAHKHVPLMEHDPEEAVKNNVLGTYQTAVAAAAHGVERFILVSTDKAVNPTNVMGASKRMCEFVVKGLADSASRIRRIDPEAHVTRYAAVRFGNVLGSNGSVIPIFKRQIEHGGPVTVTHKEMTRYFMTIPEAARLVIEAGAMASGGEIFVLDMGEPVRIDDLARNMVRLAGLEADKDIRIEYVGLRPGEKLYEELVMSTEATEPTYHPRISKIMDDGVTRESMEEGLRHLEGTIREQGDVRKALRKVVPTYAVEMDSDADQG